MYPLVHPPRPRPVVVATLVALATLLATCSAIIVRDDPPQQLFDYYYAGPELGFVSLARFGYPRPLFSVARGLVPESRNEPDTYDLHGLYNPNQI